VILALETGWTPDVIAEIPQPFREAAHHALYARALAPAVETIAQGVATDPPDALTGAKRITFISRRNAWRADLAAIRAALLPPDDEDEDDG
jgi:hypothetical protein